MLVCVFVFAAVPLQAATPQATTPATSVSTANEKISASRQLDLKWTEIAELEDSVRRFLFDNPTPAEKALAASVRARFNANELENIPSDQWDKSCRAMVRTRVDLYLLGLVAVLGIRVEGKFTGCQSKSARIDYVLSPANSSTKIAVVCKKSVPPHFDARRINKDCDGMLAQCRAHCQALRIDQQGKRTFGVLTNAQVHVFFYQNHNNGHLRCQGTHDTDEFVIVLIRLLQRYDEVATPTPIDPTKFEFLRVGGDTAGEEDEKDECGCPPQDQAPVPARGHARNDQSVLALTPANLHFWVP